MSRFRSSFPLASPSSSRCTDVPFRVVPLLPLLLTALVIALSCAAVRVESRYVLAVDLGVEWVKAATIGGSTGRATIVLNDQANRKSPQCVTLRPLRGAGGGGSAWRQVERVFAEQSLDLETRFPSRTVCGASLLAGQRAPGTTPETPETLSAEDASALPFAIVPRAPSGAAAVRMAANATDADGPDALLLTPEELVGMFLGFVRRAASRMLGGAPLRHAAVTVPTLSSLAHRQSIVDAAAAAGLRALRLVHSTTAAAAQLAHVHAAQLFPPPGGAARAVMVFDMGARHAEAAVYRLFPRRRGAGRLALLAAETNGALGGRRFDRCLAARALGNATDRPDGRRAAVRLLRAAQTARERLSVNREAPFVVPGARPDGGDAAATLTREALETACGALVEEAVRLRDAALRRAGCRLTDLARFEVIGGVTRMPLLLERLAEGFGRPADRTLNSDEAAVMGAALLGAGRAAVGTLIPMVEETATNDVFFVLSPPLASARASRRGRVVVKGVTAVPSVHSIRLVNRTGECTITLESEGGTFSRSTTIHGVAEGLQAAKAWAVSENAKQQKSEEERANEGEEKEERHKKTGGVEENATNTTRAHTSGKTRTSLIAFEQAEVVVEVTLSESGIPRVSNAFVHASYKRLEAEGTRENGKPNDPKADAAGERKEEDTQQDGDNTEEDMAGETPSETGEEETERNTEDDGDDEEKEREYKEETAPAHAAATVESANAAVSLTRGFALRFSTTVGGVNLSPDEAVAARDRLRALQRIDDERLRRSSLRNDVEAVLLQLKSHSAWGEGPAGASKDWRQTVLEVSQWLEDASDEVDVAELQKQFDRVKEIKTD